MTFFIAAAFLCLLAITFILLPLLRRSIVGNGVDNADTDRRAALVDIVRARLDELERERADGLIDDAMYAALKLEQERRLLDDVHALQKTGGKPARKMQYVLWVSALIVPLALVLLYRHVGGWQDWSIESALQTSHAQAARGEDNSATLKQLATLLEQRLEMEKDKDGRRRFMLAQLLLRLDRPQESLTHLRILLEKFPEDADLAGQYAQTLYAAANRQMTPEVQAAAERTLKLNPDQPSALGMLGVAAFQRKDYAQTLLYWRRLLRQLPPESPNAQLIAKGISQAEAALGEAGVPGPKLDISVTIAPELAKNLRGTLFVFARAVNGPPMPLAVARFDNPQLPLKITLDDTMAMAAGMNLSSFKQVQVVARITASGQVRGEAGDLEGASGPLDVSNEKQSVELVIDRRL